MRDLLDSVETSHKTHVNPYSRRNGNLLLKLIPFLFATACAIGVYWKKRRQVGRGQRKQYNVITFNQTILMVLVILLDNTLPYYFMDTLQHFQLIVEMFRTIFIETIFLKFLLPILLIINSKYHLPDLWVDGCHQITIPFSMTTPTFIPRPETETIGKSPKHTKTSNLSSQMSNITISTVSSVVSSGQLPSVDI